MNFFVRLTFLFFVIGKVLPQAITMQQGSNPERALLLHTLAEEVDFLRQYEGMSIEEGKGTGKGKGSDHGKGKIGDDKNECKGKGGMMICDEKSKKGMSKESKKDMKMEMKKGMGKGMSKDKSEFPSQSIFPSLSPPPSTTFAPSELTVAPSLVTLKPSLVITPSVPPDMDDIIQLLSPYVLLYQIEQTRIPSVSEYAELSAFTSTYLNTYFTSIFAGMTILFLNSTTNITGSEFRLGQPVRVDYNTSMSFGYLSQMIPNITELDALLASAFQGTNGEAYAAAVAAGVNPSNIFSTTSTISFQEIPADASGANVNRITLIAVISTMSILVFAASAIVIHQTSRYEKVGKASIYTEDSPTDGESHDGDSTALHVASDSQTKFRFRSEGSSRQYFHEVLKDDDNEEYQLSDLRVASSEGDNYVDNNIQEKKILEEVAF